MMFAAPVAFAPPVGGVRSPVAAFAAPVDPADGDALARARVAPVPNAAAAAASRDELAADAGSLLFSTLTPVKNPAAPKAASASARVAMGSLRRRTLGSGGWRRLVEVRSEAARSDAVR